MECTAPAIVLITPSADGEIQAEAYRGSFPPSAEQIYEWVKRALPESRTRVPQLRPTAADLERFLSPPWRPYRAGAPAAASRRDRRAEATGRGRQLAKGVVFSARPRRPCLLPHAARRPAHGPPARQRPPWGGV